MNADRKAQLAALAKLAGEDLERTLHGSYPDTGRIASSPSERLDSAFGAPIRTAIAEMQKGNFGADMLQKAWDQVGRDPEKSPAPTGEEIIHNAGIENPYLAKGLGFGVEAVSDVTSLISGTGKALGGIAGTVSKIGKAKHAATESKALKLLDEITTPEQAASLNGPDRKAYLDALDEVYGPRDQRAKDLGFDETELHGSKNLKFGTLEDKIKYYSKDREAFPENPRLGYHFTTPEPHFAAGYAGDRPTGGGDNVRKHASPKGLPTGPRA